MEKPFTLSFANFDNTEAQKLHTLFSSSELWLQPCKLSDNLEECQVILYAINNDEDVEEYFRLDEDMSQAYLVAYTEKNPDKDGWYLQRLPRGRIAFLDFCQLMNRIAGLISANGVQKPKTNNKRIASSRPSAPISAPAETLKMSVSKPEPVSSPKEDSASLLLFMDKISTVIETSATEKKKCFTDK